MTPYSPGLARVAIGADNLLWYTESGGGVRGAMVFGTPPGHLQGWLLGLTVRYPSTARGLLGRERNDHAPWEL